jgi:hypothetical protein
VLDEFDSDVGDDELNELPLPDVLANTISYAEKKELFIFKRTHNEVFSSFPPPGTIFILLYACLNMSLQPQIEWEKEVLRRSDLLARKIDMERLKRMGPSAAAAPAKGKGKVSDTIIFLSSQLNCNCGGCISLFLIRLLLLWRQRRKLLVLRWKVTMKSK